MSVLTHSEVAMDTYRNLNREEQEFVQKMYAFVRGNLTGVSSKKVAEYFANAALADCAGGYTDTAANRANDAVCAMGLDEAIEY